MSKNPIQLLRLGALRTVTTAAVKTTPVSGTATKLKPLFQRLSEGGVAETLDRWSVAGGTVTTPHLMKHVRALCRFRRRKEALEVMDWIGKKGLDMSTESHALCLDLLLKVKGIDSAKDYFLSLPGPAKDQRTYGALLYCYCRKRMKNEAIAIYNKMKELNIPTDIFAYNNLMSLHMKLGEREKVSELLEEMKASNVPPDNCTYRILIKSYASANEIDSVERAIQDMEGRGVRLDWFTYCCLAEIYNSVSLFEKAEMALKKAELVMDGRGLSPFPFLIRLYGDAGNLTAVKRVWKLLKAWAPRPNNKLYLVMLQALRKLDDKDGFEHCFKEWESCHDAKMVNNLDETTVNAIELLREKATEKGVRPNLQEDRSVCRLTEG